MKKSWICFSAAFDCRLFGDAGAVGGNIDHLFRCQALDLPEYIAQAGPYPCLS
jgi:hypothetical protein